MSPALQTLIDRYQPSSLTDWENALKEIIQELALLGLWRSKFYEHAAFYGGSALRIFHDLPRFSEDMDFSLLAADPEFELAPHLAAIETELGAYGFSFDVEAKEKRNPSAIESAFIKGSTRINLLEVEAPEELRDRLPKTQKLKIKLEIDTDPPAGADYAMETLLIPIPFQVKLFTRPCLFAGKLHAVLCRNWKSRVKGRDFYDLIWYLGRDIPCHTDHLRQRMIQSGHLDPASDWDLEVLKTRLEERFSEVDFDQAKQDVLPFIRDEDELALWSQDFFIGLIERLQAVEHS